MAGDTSGVLELATNGSTTAITIDTSQRAAFVAGTALLPAITTSGDTNTGIWFPAADTIAFAEGGAESMRIDSNGNVGIGTTSPAEKLTVTTSGSNVYTKTTDGTVNLYVGITNSSATAINGTISNHPYGFFTNNTERMRISSGGDLTLGTTDTSVTSGTGIKFLPSNNASVATMGLVGNSSSAGQGSYHLYSTSLSQYQFYVLYNGTIAARSGSITVLSDQSEKTNVRDLETGLNEVLALKPRRFDWIKDQGTNIVGFIAQEVQTILPDLIEPYKISDEETKLGLKMGDMLPTLVNAIQEQQTIINDLKARITALEGAA
jgi:hypothetical protein